MVDTGGERTPRTPPPEQPQQQSHAQRRARAVEEFRMRIRESQQNIDARTRLRQEFDTEIEGAVQQAIGTQRMIAEEKGQIRTIGRSPRAAEVEHGKNEAHITLSKLIVAIQENLKDPPQINRTIFLNLSGRAELTPEAATYLLPIVNNYLTQQITFSQQGQQATNFEEVFARLKTENDTAAKVLGQAIIQAAEGQNIGITPDLARERFTVEAQTQEFADPEVEMAPEQFMREYLHSTEGQELLTKLEKKDHKLLAAIYSPRRMEKYVKDTLLEQLFENSPNANINGLTYERYLTLPEGELKDEIGKLVSKELTRRVRLLIGKVYRRADEEDPEEFWEAIEQKGAFMRAVQYLSGDLTARIEALRRHRYSDDSVMSKINWHRGRFVSDDRVSPSHALYSNIARGARAREESELVEYSYEDEVKTETYEFLQTVASAVNDEVNIRKAVHNARALFYKGPGEHGYYTQLAHYVGEFMKGDAIDIMHTIDEGRNMGAASQLLDKLTEAGFAKYNHRWQPTFQSSDPNTKLTDIETRALEYLKMLPDAHEVNHFTRESQLKDEWLLKRALVMAIGESYSVSLRSLEHGARADAPRNLKTGQTTYASYDKYDAKPYMALNPWNQYNVRYAMEDRTTLGNLLFMPIERQNEGSLRGLRNFAQKWVGGWNHNQAMREMMKSVNSFVNGKEMSDYNDNVSRLIDMTNFGGAGSIYTRKGWRFLPMYQAHLDGEGRNFNILNSWKAVENIGIDVMQDFTGHIGSLNANFYESGGQTMRRDLVDYLHTKYIRDRSADEWFDNLERGDPSGLEGRYKTFYYQVLTRAVKQRIPTKFIRFERNRDVREDQDRAWEDIKQRSGLAQPQYERALEDIMAAEVLLRRQATDTMMQGVELQREHGREFTQVRLNEIDVNNYEMTEGRLRELLTQMLAEERDPQQRAQRLANAMTVFDRISTKETSEYLDRFARDWQGGIAGGTPGSNLVSGKVPFSFAHDELEKQFLAHRGAGQGLTRRAAEDLNNVEEKTSVLAKHYFEKLKDLANNPEKDLSELVEMLKQAKMQMEVDTDPEQARKVVYYLSTLTMMFFRKDTLARNIFTRWFKQGQKNSMAAEFTGLNRGVREWDKNDEDMWLRMIEGTGILPADPYISGKPPNYGPFRIRGITIPFLRSRMPDMKYFGGKIRGEQGVTGRHLTLDQLQKWAPWFIGFIAYQYITNAFKETEEDK